MKKFISKMSLKELESVFKKFHAEDPDALQECWKYLGKSIEEAQPSLVHDEGLWKVGNALFTTQGKNLREAVMRFYLLSTLGDFIEV